MKNKGIRVSTVRAGNVIGGGDFAENRIIPDCLRAALESKKIIIRNPKSIRPYQHVLEPLFAYLLIAKKQYEDEKYASSYNIGPDFQDCVTTGEITSIFCNIWGENITWESIDNNSNKNNDENKKCDNKHEAKILKLDCSKIKNTFGWKPCWNIDKAIEKTVEFGKAYRDGLDISKLMNDQINEYKEVLNKL